MPIKVTLRKKPIFGNRSSLYLDFYPEIKNPITGEPTRREFLKMYLYNPIKTVERKTKNGIKKIPVFDLNPGINQTYETHNSDTLNVAEQIRQKRQNQLYKPEIYSGFEQEQLKIKQNGEKDFAQYFLYLADKRKSSNYDNWISASHYLKKFTNGSLKFSELNESFCYRFREFILTAPKQKSNKKSLSKTLHFPISISLKQH